MANSHSSGTVQAVAGRLAVYSERTAEVRYRGTTAGWIGILCLVPYWTARFVPEIGNGFASSSFGKLAVLGALLAGVHC